VLAAVLSPSEGNPRPGGAARAGRKWDPVPRRLDLAVVNGVVALEDVACGQRRERGVARFGWSDDEVGAVVAAAGASSVLDHPHDRSTRDPELLGLRRIGDVVAEADDARLYVRADHVRVVNSSAAPVMSPRSKIRIAWSTVPAIAPRPNLQRSGPPL
jgi:hypothetical protein